MISIQDNEFGDLVVCAFRYALGRKTYIVPTIADLIIKYRLMLSKTHTEVIVRDIWGAFETNNYGMGMDKEEWQKVLNVLELKNE